MATNVSFLSEPNLQLPVKINSSGLAQASNPAIPATGNSPVREEAPSSGSTKLSSQHQTTDLSTRKSTPDPRWPHLNKWSSPSLLSSPLAMENATSSPTSLSQRSEVPPSSALISTPAVEIPASVVVDKTVFPTSLSKGAWEKPLSFCSNLQKQPSGVNMSEKSQWLELAGGYKKRVIDSCPTTNSTLSHDPTYVGCSESEAANIKAHSKDYPWAAKMNQSLRNLHRVTIPEFMEDGTPKVRIPSHVLLGGVENQKEFVVGQFYRCFAPSSGQIQAVVTRIWGKKCRIFIRKLGESKYLFHIPDESTRKWVLQRGLWHVDDCLMFVSPWSTKDTISLPEITTVPVWLTLNNIPDQLYSFLGIKWIASGIGEPMLTEKPWLDPTQMGKAKILVEVKLDKPFPQRVALVDRSDTITMVDVLYSWLPSTCSGCGQLGHKASRCLLINAEKVSRPVANAAQKISGNSLDTSQVRNDNSMDTSQIRHDNGKAPIAALIPIIEVERQEQENPCISVPAINFPVYAQEISASISTTPTAAPPMAKGSFAKSVEKMSSNVAARTTLNNSSGLIKSNETNTTKGVSPLAIQVQVERSLRRSLSSATMQNNRFSSLDSSEDKEDDVDLDIESEHEDFLTPAGKRILRERPVKPSTKVKEMQGHPVASGRGNRGRGNRSGRG